MTRFARSKGSKASNERTPGDSTPWEVMKEQLLQAKKESEDSKNRKEAEQKRIENYENFLKERKVLKRKAVWCDFPESEQKKKSSTISGNTELKPTKKKRKNNNNETEIRTDGEAVNSSKKNKSIKVNESQNKSQTINVTDIENKVIEGVTGDNSARKKKKKQKKIESLNGAQLTNTDNGDLDNTVMHSKKLKKNKINNEANEQQKNTQLDVEIPIQNNKKNKKKKYSQKSDAGQPLNREPDMEVQDIGNSNNLKPKQPNQKKKKNIDGKPLRRKEINDRSFQLIINGKDIELIRFDGFPVMKKDAERLEELKSSMIKKGIPKSEVQRTIKLERRRAEKALARVKREVCYNCRKGGHVLSDCPELKSKIPGADTAEGVCFKCGSTEHRQFECKVQKDKEFRFATCFICKEAGHIARQCPDNPKGLYPNGGSCKLCGDVTHLRKDCPTVMDKKEGSSIKLKTLNAGDDIEDVGQQTNTFTNPELVKKPKKITF